MFITAAMINLFEDITKEEEQPEPKPEETIEEIIIHDHGNISNANEIKSTTVTDTLPKTRLKTIILIISIVIAILVVVFYLKVRKK